MVLGLETTGRLARDDINQAIAHSEQSRHDLSRAREALVAAFRLVDIDAAGLHDMKFAVSLLVTPGGRLSLDVKPSGPGRTWREIADDRAHIREGIPDAQEGSSYMSDLRELEAELGAEWDAANRVVAAAGEAA